MSDLDLKTATSEATSKDTPVDADRINLFDSASSWAFKALTWANLKATLKAYFDTLYNKYTLETHASNHTDGTDDIQDATDSVKGLATAAQITTLDSAVQPAETVTLTNKRITPRVLSTTSSATPTINTDNCDIYQLTAQTEAITSFTTNLSGTPVEGDCLIIEIQGTAERAITWGASFEASTVALPTTTVTTAKLSVAFLYNDVTDKWRCVGVA